MHIAHRLVTVLATVLFLTINVGCDSADPFNGNSEPQYSLELLGSNPLTITVSQAEAWLTSDPGAVVICDNADDPNLGVIRRSDNAPRVTPGDDVVRYTFRNAEPVIRGVRVVADDPACNSTLTFTPSVNDLTVTLDIESSGFDVVEVDFGSGYGMVRTFTHESYGTYPVSVRGRKEGCLDIVRTLSVTLTDPGNGGGDDNYSPIAYDDTAVIEINEVRTVDVTENDIDPDEDSFQLVSISDDEIDGIRFSLVNGGIRVQAPSSPRDQVTVQYVIRDEHGAEGVGNLRVRVQQSAPSCTPDIGDGFIDIGTTRSDQPVDFNYLAETVAVNCTDGSLAVRNVAVNPNSINLSPLANQGPGWYRMTNFSGLANGTTATATAEAYYTNGNVSGGIITVQTRIQISDPFVGDTWCGTRATQTGVVAVRACWVDGRFGDLTQAVQRR